jgi:RNA polymerase-binding transcription factor DksA
VTREADDLDQASELTQQLTDAYVSNVRDAARPEQVQLPDGSWPHPDCIDCGDEILPARLALGRVRCVSCQQDLERWVR